MFYVYILQSKEHYYTGFTTDLKKRLAKHNANGNIATKGRGPWKVIFYEAYLHQEDAKRREKYLKTSVGRRMVKRMLREHFKSE